MPANATASLIRAQGALLRATLPSAWCRSGPCPRSAERSKMPQRRTQCVLELCKRVGVILFVENQFA